VNETELTGGDSTAGFDECRVETAWVADLDRNVTGQGPP